MASVIIADVWQWTPFMFLILLAGLQAIPQEPYEAALVDGSTPWQTFRYVTLPLLKPGNSNRAAATHHGFTARIRSHFYFDGRWAGIRYRDIESLYLSHGLSLFEFRIRRRYVVCLSSY
jgi:hypothetical protein